jgi:hypothetical protein
MARDENWLVTGIKSFSNNYTGVLLCFGVEYSYECIFQGIKTLWMRIPRNYS